MLSTNSNKTSSGLVLVLLQLIDILRDKEIDSYESACNYVVDIFR